MLKETTEALVGAAALAALLSKEVKLRGLPTNWATDALILKDLLADLASDPVFRGKLLTAVSGASLIPAEIKGITPDDMWTLGKAALEEFETDFKDFQ
jgi:hypothetical protein